MTDLFTPLTLGSLSLANRIVMAPMTRSRNDDHGCPTDIMATYYAQRAGAGLIIAEATYVSPIGKGYSRIPGLHSQAQTEAWRKVVDAVHAKGGKIVAQLFHTGRVAVPPLLPPGEQPVAPSAIAIKGKNYTDFGPIDHVVPRALDEREIAGVADQFGAAAANAIAAGFDGVELHAASGYLVHQFLDAGANTRTDSYGGSVENRARFALEALDAITRAAGVERVGVKFSPRIKFNDVSEPDAEAVYPYLAEQLSKRGVAYLHVAQQPGYEAHKLLRPLFTGRYIAGTGFDRASGEAMLASGGADAIAFGKPFIANPDLPLRFRDNLSLAEADMQKAYSKGPEGYSDYPAASGG